MRNQILGLIFSFSLLPAAVLAMPICPPMGKSKVAMDHRRMNDALYLPAVELFDSYYYHNKVDLSQNRDLSAEERAQIIKDFRNLGHKIKGIASTINDMTARLSQTMSDLRKASDTEKTVEKRQNSIQKHVPMFLEACDEALIHVEAILIGAEGTLSVEAFNASMKELWMAMADIKQVFNLGHMRTP